MDRLNNEGVPLADLRHALRNRSQVAAARRIDRCLICRRAEVNEAGLCYVCFSMLEGEARELAVRWTSGAGP